MMDLLGLKVVYVDSAEDRRMYILTEEQRVKLVMSMQNQWKEMVAKMVANTEHES